MKVNAHEARIFGFRVKTCMNRFVKSLEEFYKASKTNLSVSCNFYEFFMSEANSYSKSKVVMLHKFGTNSVEHREGETVVG